MLKLFVRSLLFWLSLFEVLASARRWRGLSWSNTALDARLLGVLPLTLLATTRAGWPARVFGLVLAAPFALVIQVAASSLRNRGLNPLMRMRPGSYERSTITRLDIPMDEGFLPVLHVEPTAGTKKAVCVLHGSGCDKTYYAWRLADALLDAGCAILLIDLDGHGDNPRTQRFPNILDDPRTAVGWLRERYERVGIIGISLGGCITARALAEGLAVERVAILESPPKLQFGRREMWGEGLGLAHAELLDMFADSTPYALYRAWQAPPIRAQISTWDLIDKLDLLASLPRIQAPLLLLYGANDAIVKPAQAYQVQAHMPAGARFELIAHASHITLQVMPQTLRELEQWFREL